MRIVISKKERRLISVSLLIVIVLVLSAYYYWIWLPSFQLTGSGYQDLTVEQARQLIKANPELEIVDVRTLGEFDSGHINGSICIPVDTLQGRLGELNLQSGILVYCASGTRSAQAAKILTDNGFQNVYNMLGGINDWIKAGYDQIY